jgi:Tfp pilus assembly protein PilV
MQTHPIRRLSRGATLVEVLLSVALVSFSFSSLFALYSVTLRTVRAQEETIAATLYLHERCDQIRAANWGVITNAERLRSSILASSTAPATLRSLEQVITVNAHPIPSATPIRVRRQNTTSTILSQPSDASISGSAAVRVDVRASWASQGRTRSREASMIVAVGGALR